MSVFPQSINNSIHPEAEEVTIVGNHVEENLFNSKNVSDELLTAFRLEMLTTFGEVVDLDKLQQFSFQAADGKAYTEHKFMVVFSGGKTDCHHTSVPVVNPHDDYCVNYFTLSLNRVPKFYDLDVHNHTWPDLLEGSVTIDHWGIGVSENPTIKDVYFLHPNPRAVAAHFNMPVPYLDEIGWFTDNTTFDKVFGLTYDTNTLEPIKLKMYYYPGDPNMEHTVFDEVHDDQSS